MATAFYSILHMLVDGVCAYGMFRYFTADHQNFLLYNFCAFALQMPFGLALDMLMQPARRRQGADGICAVCALSGALLSLSGLYLGPVALGVGNALFHVGGGVASIREDDRRTQKGRLLGIFVAPGALGIYVGRLLGTANPAAGYALPVAAFAALILLGAAFAAYRRSGRTALDGAQEEARQNPDGRGLSIKAAALCLVVVMIRSYVGMSAAFLWQQTAVLSLFSVLAAVFGKAAGGFLLARAGMKRAVCISLLAAAVCFCLGGFWAPGLLALFFFQMTMPVTLYLLAGQMRGTPGFSFGLLTFGLFLGFLPAYLGLPVYLPGQVLGAAGSLVSLLLLLGGGRACHTC